MPVSPVVGVSIFAVAHVTINPVVWVTAGFLYALVVVIVGVVPVVGVRLLIW